MQNCSHLLALAPGEFVFSRHFTSYFFSISSLFGISFPLKKLVSKSDKIAHLTQNWTHRTSNQQNWSILHPARRLHSHLDSLRSTTIQPCTRFAGIPEALFRPFLWASPFPFFAVQHGATVHFVARCVCDTSPL